MSTKPTNEEPGFENGINELPNDQDGGDPDTLEESQPEGEKADEMEEAQKDAAEQRKEGGYQ